MDHHIKENPTPEQLKRGLAHFYGTESYYKIHPQILITDGVKYLCDNAGTYWLIDLIWSTYPKLKHDWLHHLTLTVNLEDHSGAVTITNGDERIVHQQELEFTDFLLKRQDLFICALDGGANEDGRKVVMLTSEY